MNCQDTQRWLGAYRDGELDLTRNLELEQHLRGCTNCAQANEVMFATRKQIRAAAFSAPEDLRRRLQATVVPERKPATTRRPTFNSWFSWGLSTAAASLVLAFVLTQTVFHRNNDAMILSEIADSHIRAMVGNHLVDVVSSDQHTVRPWFEGKVDFAPAVPDLSAKGFEIIGGRLDYIAGHSAATLVYQCRKHYISLFISPASKESGAVRPINFERKPAQRGYNVVHWKSGSMEYWAISEINAEELLSFAQAFTNPEN